MLKHKGRCPHANMNGAIPLRCKRRDCIMITPCRNGDYNSWDGVHLVTDYKKKLTDMIRICLNEKILSEADLFDEYL